MEQTEGSEFTEVEKEPLSIPPADEPAVSQDFHFVEVKCEPFDHQESEETAVPGDFEFIAVKSEPDEHQMLSDSASPEKFVPLKDEHEKEQTQSEPTSTETLLIPCATNDHENTMLSVDTSSLQLMEERIRRPGCLYEDRFTDSDRDCQR